MSDLDVSRRGFLVMISGTVLGSYVLPGGPGVPATDASGAGVVARRLLSRPLRKKSHDRVFTANSETAFFLLWTELDASNKAQVMVWTPETAEEIAEANRFYQEACALNPGPALDLPPLSAEELALTEALFDAPDEPGPRLAYAAYLRAKGNTQGEFVEVNHVLETTPEDDPAQPAIDVRWSELLSLDAEKWLAPLASLGVRPEIFGTYFPALWLADTGLVEELDLEQAGLLPERAEELILAAPAVHRLKIGYDDVDLAALAQCPYLGRLTSLELSSLNLQAETLAPLLESPYLIRLRRLDLGYNDLGPDAGAALARAGFLARLRELDLSSNEMAEGAIELFQGWSQGELQRLAIGNNLLGPEALAALAACPALRGLRALRLHETALDLAGLEALATAPFLATLEELDLSSCQLDAESLATLIELPLPALARLKLNGNRFGEAGALVLAQARWPKLSHLDLETCDLADAGLTALSGSALFAHLVELSLYDNGLGPRGVSALAKVAWTGDLRKLNLRQNRCAEDGAKVVAGCSGLAGLTELDLNGNNLGAVGAAALANSPHLKHLTRLYVSGRFLGPTGKDALLQRFGEDVLQVEED